MSRIEEVAVEPLTSRVKAALASLPISVERVRVEPSDYAKVVAVVESDTFESMTEYERQMLLWGHLIDHLPDQDWTRIAAVFAALPGQAV